MKDRTIAKSSLGSKVRGWVAIPLIITTLLLPAACSAAASPSPVVYATSGAGPDASTQPELEGSEWLLVSLEGNPPLTGTEITLSFAEGRLGGSAGCNSYGGAYTLKDKGAIDLSEVAVTLQACTSPEGIMKQEAAYLAALEKLTKVQVEGDKLQLLCQRGRTLATFQRKPD